MIYYLVPTLEKLPGILEIYPPKKTEGFLWQKSWQLHTQGSHGHEKSEFGCPKSGKMANDQKVRKIEHEVRKSQDFSIKLDKCKK